MAIKQIQNNELQNILVDFPILNQRIFIDLQSDTQPLVLNDKCKHRGGPLHLCTKDKNGNKRCIWHNMKIPLNPNISNKVGVIFYKSSNIITMVCGNKKELWLIKLISN